MSRRLFGGTGPGRVGLWREDLRCRSSTGCSVRELVMGVDCYTRHEEGRDGNFLEGVVPRAKKKTVDARIQDEGRGMEKRI